MTPMSVAVGAALLLVRAPATTHGEVDCVTATVPVIVVDASDTTQGDVPWFAVTVPVTVTVFVTKALTPMTTLPVGAVPYTVGEPRFTEFHCVMLLVAVPVKVALTRRLPARSVESRTWSPALYVGAADEATAGNTPKLSAIGAALLCVRVPVTRRLSLVSLRRPTMLVPLNDIATVPVKFVADDAVPSAYC